MFCSSKQGRPRLNTPPHTNTKISPGVCRTAETFSFSLLEHPPWLPNNRPRAALLSLSWEKRLGKKGAWKPSAGASSQPLRSHQHWRCCVLWIFNREILVARTPIFRESTSKGFPLQKLKIMKWIQDWPLNHTYSSAKVKHGGAREPFRNKYIHITPAPLENMYSFLSPHLNKGN